MFEADIGEGIGEELVEVILLRSPVKSLVRFRSVCKHWNSLITNPKFINNHLQLNQDKSRTNVFSEVSLVLGWTHNPGANGDEGYNDPELDKKQRLSLLTVKSCTRSNDQSDNNVVPCNFEPIYLPLLPKVLHPEESFLTPLNGFHCNGILCLVDHSPFFSERVAFYNPALREQKLIHTLPDYEDNYFFRACGFGYDPRSNDYKFVRILTPDFNMALVTKAEVYTLGTGSWRESAIELDRRVMVSNSGAYLRGFYYWVSSPEQSILSFDMSEDKFGTLTIPKEVCDVKLSHEKWLSLSVWNDSLVLFFYLLSPKSIEMWVRCDNNDVWTKHVIMEPFGCFYEPVTFWKSDEVLMEAQDGQLLSYNLYTKSSRKFPIHGAILPGATYASIYVESLVSVKLKTRSIELSC